MPTKPSAPHPLEKYRAKRNFKKTAEPAGARRSKSEGQSYLIQKHAARRLHYDFRLEMNGALKSWAVTRGPSLDPEDKRLAVHVEDHPLEYGNFEGTIPQGEYGGGTVMLWDRGTWEPIGDGARGYAKGHLDFELHGKRLKGRWHLVRMRGTRRGDEKGQNWLLIKGKDQYADTNGDQALEKYKKSVVSGRSMEAIAKESGKVWKTKAEKPKPEKEKPTPRNKSTILPAPPDFVPPQLATLVSQPPKGEGWIHEIKFDGYRLMARVENGQATMTTRANNDWTAKFKELADRIAKLKVNNALIDGEVVHMTPDGAMAFHALQNALSTRKTTDLRYYAFDLLFLNGEDLRHEPLLERKKLLKALLKKTPPHIHYSEHFVEDGEKVLHQVCHISLEGIVSKRTNAPYHSGRDEKWLKSKCIHEQEIVIGGYTMQAKHPGFLAALLMGYYQNGDFIYAGKVGTGFSTAEGRDLLKKLKAIEQKNAPFKSFPSASRHGAFFVKPKLVAHVNFAEWTPDGAMRHPSFQGLREDKPAKEVSREKAKPPPRSETKKSAPPTKTAPVKPQKSGKENIAGISISHPDKIFWPEEGITKRRLAEYYEEVAPYMLPFIANRPISLLRCPEGTGKACFFQRHGSDSPHIKPVKVKNEKQPYLIIEDVRGLIALAQMGALEIHVWGAKPDAPETPDTLVFDLDPAPDVAWTEVKNAAQDIRTKLKSLKLNSFLKSTGGKGLHVIVPFTDDVSWDQAKNFARAFSEAMAGEAPQRFTTNNRKSARTGKIYIDYLRNGQGASSIAPYSPRAREGAPVALPLDWKELPRLKSGHEFTITNAAKHLKKNPWKDISKIKQKLPH